MAKTPNMVPPVSLTETETHSAPTISVDNSSSFSGQQSDSIPTINPPNISNESSEGSFGAGVWFNDKRINALFSTNDTRNSWIHVVGIGWLKLSNNFDSSNLALTILAKTAKEKNSPVNYLLDANQVIQIYVW